MFGSIGRWLSEFNDASKRMENAALILERSTGKLEAVIDRAVKDSSNDMKDKADRLRSDLDKIRN